MYINLGFNQTLKGTIVNNGTALGNAIITGNIKGTVSEYKIIDDASGKYIRIVTTLVNTDIIKIDLEKQSITLNGSNAMLYLDLASRFFKIPLGTSTYTITPTNTQVTIITLKPQYL